MPVRDETNSFGLLFDTLPAKSKFRKLIKKWHDEGFGNLSAADREYINSVSAHSKSVIDSSGQVTIEYLKGDPGSEALMATKFLQVYKDRYLKLALNRKPLSVCKNCNRFYEVRQQGTAAVLCSRVCRLEFSRANKKKAGK